MGWVQVHACKLNTQTKSFRHSKQRGECEWRSPMHITLYIHKYIKAYLFNSRIREDIFCQLSSYCYPSHLANSICRSLWQSYSLELRVAKKFFCKRILYANVSRNRLDSNPNLMLFVSCWRPCKFIKCAKNVLNKSELSKIVWLWFQTPT